MSLLGSNCLLATTLLWCSCRSSNSLLCGGLLALWCCLLSGGLLALWCCLLGNNLLGGGLLALWCCLLNGGLLALWCCYCFLSSGLLATLWRCYFHSGLLALWSRFLSCSHVLLQSEWSDPSPDLFMDKRVSSWWILPALCEKYLSACRELLFYFFVLSRKIFDFIFGYPTQISSRNDGSISGNFLSLFLGRHEHRSLRHIASAITQPSETTTEMSVPGRGKFHGEHHQPRPSWRRAFLPAN